MSVVDGHIGNFNPDVHSIWSPTFCIENVKQGTEELAAEYKQRGFNWVQCMDNCLCIVFNIICIVVNVYLLAFILASHGWGKAVRNLRFWIFALTLILNISLLTSDTFNFGTISDTFRRVLIIFDWTIKSAVLLTVSYYFTRQSRQLVLE